MEKWEIYWTDCFFMPQDLVEIQVEQPQKEDDYQEYTELENLAHLLSATVRVYSLVAPCRLPDLTSLALLESASGQPRLSRSPCLATRGFQNGGCSFKIQPPSPYFHKDLARLFTPQHLWAVFISCLLSC